MNFIRKYMKYFNNFLKNVQFNSVQNVNSVQRSRVHVMVHVTFLFNYSMEYNALSPLRPDAKEAV